MLTIVTPCFFDVKSFRQLREQALVALAPHLAQLDRVQFLLLDDSAGTDPEVAGLPADVKVLTCPFNLGHQSALVYGLRAMAQDLSDGDLVVTMDSDGEDRPGDIPAMLIPLLKNDRAQIVLAERTRREEGLIFKFFYTCFKAFFGVLTGTIIKNGNFVALRAETLKKIIFHPHFNFVYSSSFISLPLALDRVLLPRGRRFYGESKMGGLGLFTHGLRMLLPFASRISVKFLLIFSLLFSFNIFWLLALLILAPESHLPLLISLGLMGPFMGGLGLSVMGFLIFNVSHYAQFYDVNRDFAPGKVMPLKRFYFPPK